MQNNIAVASGHGSTIVRQSRHEPLSQTSEQTSNSDDDRDPKRRRGQRIPIESSGKQPKAALHINGGCYPCTIVNISIGGLCLQLKEGFEPGLNSSGYLTIENESSDLEAKYTINMRWLEQNQDWVIAGFEFSGSEAGAYESIRSCLIQPTMEADPLTGMDWL